MKKAVLSPTFRPFGHLRRPKEQSTVLLNCILRALQLTAFQLCSYFDLKSGTTRSS